MNSTRCQIYSSRPIAKKNKCDVCLVDTTAPEVLMNIYEIQAVDGACKGTFTLYF